MGKANELATERKILQNELSLLRRHHKDCLKKVAEAQQMSEAWAKTAQEYARQMSEKQDKFYQLGNELEELTGTKRVSF